MRRRLTQWSNDPAQTSDVSKRLLQDIKNSLKTRKLEGLEQINCQERLDLQFNKDTWEKFHLLKHEIDDSKGVVQAFSEKLKDLKFPIYFGAASQMVQQAHGKVILVGGLGINYKNSLV